MADNTLHKKALDVFDTLCAYLDEEEFHYERRTDMPGVNFTVEGEDLPMEFAVLIDEERQAVRLLSFLPVTFGKDKRIEGAIAACRANYSIIDGSFDYNYKTGKMTFRMTAVYLDSLFSKGLFDYMLACAFYTVDKYNDKFLMIAKGFLPIEDFFGED